MTVEDDRYTALAVTMGRIEEGIRTLNEKFDGLARDSKDHSDTLGDHETRLAVIEAQRVPRAPWWSVVGGITGLVSIATTVVVVIVYLTKGTP